MSSPLLAIRADHGPHVGGGHFGRCLALAQAWVDAGGQVVLLADAPPPSWADRWRAEGAELRPASAWPAAAAYVLDGYHFGPDDQRAVPDDGPLLVIDDLGQVAVGRADVVLDQNLGAERRPRWPAASTALLGPRFALVRREVVAARRGVRRHRTDPPSTIVLSAGSSPPPEWWTLFRDAAATGVPELEVVALAGVANVGASLVAGDIGLLAAGSTVWDALLVGLPCVVVAMAGNQTGVARALGEAGAALDGGDGGDATPAGLAAYLRHLASDGPVRQRLAEVGAAVVDGEGAARVAATLRGLSGTC